MSVIPFWKCILLAARSLILIPLFLILLGRQELSILEREEENHLEEKLAAEREASEVELHSIAFVERLNGSQLFYAMFENDPDGQVLVKISEETKEFYETYPFISVTTTVKY